MQKVLPGGTGLKILLTGPVQIGKSTIVDRAVGRLPFSVGGIRTRRVPADRDRVSYLLVDVMTGVAVEFARAGPGGVKVDSRVFDTAGADAIRRSINETDLTLLDELGRMEREAGRFQRQVLAALEGPGRVLGVVKAERNPFLDEVRGSPNVDVLEVTLGNRDHLVDLIVARMTAERRPPDG